MELDTDHSFIERKKKQRSVPIYLLNDWYQLVRLTSSKFKVNEMDQTDFYNFAAMFRTVFVCKKEDSK